MVGQWGGTGASYGEETHLGISEVFKLNPKVSFMAL